MKNHCFSFVFFLPSYEFWDNPFLKKNFLFEKFFQNFSKVKNILNFEGIMLATFEMQCAELNFIES